MGFTWQPLIAKTLSEQVSRPPRDYMDDWTLTCLEICPELRLLLQFCVPLLGNYGRLSVILVLRGC